jgi:HK97 family phage portal protein
MKKTSVLVMTAQGMKSMSLNAALQQSEGWTSVIGGDASGGGTVATYYERVPWLYAGVNLIARSVATLPLKFCAVGGDGEVMDAAANVPWLQSFLDLLDVLAGDLVLYGAAYAFLGRNARGRATQLRRLMPTSVKPVVDATAGLTGFERTVNGGRVALALEDVVYIWQPNRTGETGPGTAPARAALAAAGALASIDASTENLFANGAIRPTIAFIDESMPDAELQRVESTIKRRLQGVKNAFGFTAVSKKVEFSTIGDKPSDLTMPELTESKRQDVATALGVPQTLLFSNAANYATASQDDFSFYDKTVIPIAVRLLSAFNTQLFESMGFIAETAEEELELYQQMQGEQVTALAQMFDRRVVTVNEFRERVGFAPLEDPAMPEEPQSDPEAPGEDTQDASGDGTPEPDTSDPAADELRAWQRFVTKRLKDGRPLRAFETKFIPATTKAAIEGQLDGETDVNAVKAVFDDAVRWSGYP